MLASERWQLLALGVFALVTRLPLLAYPKACDDEQVYAVVGMEMLHGGRPYIDAIERKPPLLFYLYEALFRLGGAYDYFAVHLAALVWTMATMAALHALVRGMFDAQTGVVAALLYAIFVAWADYTNLALNGELLMNLPVVLAFLLARRPSLAKVRFELLASGALVAVAFLLKQPSVVAGVPLAVYVLHPDYRSQRALGWGTSLLHAAMLAVGFVLTLLAMGSVLVREGILAEAWYWTISNHANPLGPTTWFFWHKLPLTGTFFVAETLPLLLAAAMGIREGLRREGNWRGCVPNSWRFCCSWPAAVLGVTVNGQFLYHYFLQLIPPLALLAAPTLVALWQENTGRVGSRFSSPPALVRVVDRALCAAVSGRRHHRALA